MKLIFSENLGIEKWKKNTPKKPFGNNFNFYSCMRDLKKTFITLSFCTFVRQTNKVPKTSLFRPP